MRAPLYYNPDYCYQGAGGGGTGVALIAVPPFFAGHRTVFGFVKGDIAYRTFQGMIPACFPIFKTFLD